MAVSSPLLEASIDGAHGVLLSIAGGSDLGLFEINEAAALVAQAVHPEANIIFGATIDDALGDEVRVTVIAAGFDGGQPKRRDEGTVLRRDSRPQQTQEETRAAVQAASRRPDDRGAERVGATAVPPQGQRPAQAPQQQGQAGQAGQPGQPGQQAQPAQQQSAPRPAPRQVQFDDDDLDVPDFLK
jgi:cell division protein FtsZ